jgi:hypothetical protein
MGYSAPDKDYTLWKSINSDFSVGILTGLANRQAGHPVILSSGIQYLPVMIEERKICGRTAPGFARLRCWSAEFQCFH